MIVLGPALCKIIVRWLLVYIIDLEVKTYLLGFMDMV